jgi:glycosyltransferase involved in cell wall biosynthesis
MIMEEKLPFVTAIVPCRNEEKFIGQTLDSIISNDYPKDSLEILIVDGESSDKTVEIAEKYVKAFSFIKIIDNPKKITPAALNLGIKNSKGEIIIKMDAHSGYQSDYISKCVKYLTEWEKEGAWNVGGILKTVPSGKTLVARAIAMSLSSKFGAGSSLFRTGAIEKPVWADTVAFGCYRKETLEKIGRFDERMEKIEDFELNARLRKAGGKILLAPDIVAFYYPSSENFSGFFKHNFTDGFWTTYPIKFGFHSFSLRHLIPLAFVSSLLFTLILGQFIFLGRLIFDLIFLAYMAVSLFFSFLIALKNGWKYFFIMPMVFIIRHVGYGLGSIFGFLKLYYEKLQGLTNKKS